MKKIVCLLLCLSSWCGYATGNYQAGQTKSASCAACHGPQGVSMNPLWPNLAGQHATYLMKQLHDFKSNLRHADMMSPFVATLTDQDIEDLALFYARQSPAEHQADAQNTRGAALYRGGDMTKHITACIACHGPQGTGNEQAGFPSLVGQHEGYAVSQLEAFKEKTRHNDMNEIMQMISARMSKEDMVAVANYLMTLH